MAVCAYEVLFLVCIWLHWFYTREKERLTPEDVDTIFKLVLKYRKEWADQKGCYPEVIEEFYKTKRK